LPPKIKIKIHVEQNNCNLRKRENVPLQSNINSNPLLLPVNRYGLMQSLLIMIEPQHILKKASRKMVQNRASFFSIWMLLVQTDGDLQKINTVAFKARL
jgi:hypothetical protein